VSFLHFNSAKFTKNFICVGFKIANNVFRLSEILKNSLISYGAKNKIGLTKKLAKQIFSGL
jgi:hypothetical protein